MGSMPVQVEERAAAVCHVQRQVGRALLRAAAAAAGMAPTRASESKEPQAVHRHACPRDWAGAGEGAAHGCQLQCFCCIADCWTLPPQPDEGAEQQQAHLGGLLQRSADNTHVVLVRCALALLATVGLNSSALPGRAHVDKVSAAAVPPQRPGAAEGMDGQCLQRSSFTGTTTCPTRVQELHMHQGWSAAAPPMDAAGAAPPPAKPAAPAAASAAAGATAIPAAMPGAAGAAAAAAGGPAPPAAAAGAPDAPPDAAAAAAAAAARLRPSCRNLLSSREGRPAGPSSRSSTSRSKNSKSLQRW